MGIHRKPESGAGKDAALWEWFVTQKEQRLANPRLPNIDSWGLDQLEAFKEFIERWEGHSLIMAEFLVPDRRKRFTKIAQLAARYALVRLTFLRAIESGNVRLQNTLKLEMLRIWVQLPKDLRWERTDD